MGYAGTIPGTAESTREADPSTQGTGPASLALLDDCDQLQIDSIEEVSLIKFIGGLRPERHR